MRIDTVRIVAAEAPGGWLLINRSDFDERRHRLWPEASAEAADSDPEPEKDEPEKGEGPEKPTPEAPAEPRLDDMSVAELREYAKAHGLDAPAGTTTKAAMLAALRAAGGDRK